MPDARCPIPYPQLTMPDAPCPMPESQLTMPDARFPIPNSQFPILIYHLKYYQSAQPQWLIWFHTLGTTLSRSNLHSVAIYPLFNQNTFHICRPFQCQLLIFGRSAFKIAVANYP